jgi:hypothetical protein
MFLNKTTEQLFDFTKRRSEKEIPNKMNKEELDVSRYLSICILIRVRVTVTLRQAVYRQSVRLGAKILETHDQHFFFQLNTCDHSPYITSSLARWVTKPPL